MSHLVIYRSDDGSTGYHRAGTLDEAVGFVERLRNGNGVERARLYRLEEVSFEFRPYFKVEVAGAVPPVDTVSVPAPNRLAAVVEAVSEPEPEPEPEPEVEPELEPVASDPADGMAEVVQAGDTESDERNDGDAPVTAVTGRRGLFGR